ncbi:MAG: response regulator, partial [Bdellovibrionota bacterium]
ALRVLLADESVTIKKVFQLSLKDYGVDVVTVTSGLDVLPVAKKSKPDIIFADVILQKKSGYDVCAEIRRDPELRNVPVVLIWSGFMELDADRYKACQASGNLEKPFDTAKLRQVIQSLVPKTKSQNIGQYLHFPKLPDFDETSRAQVPAPTPDEDSNVLNFNNTATNARPPERPTQPKPAPENSSAWSMDNFEPLHVPSDDTSMADDNDLDSVAELDLSETPDEFVPVDLPSASAPSKAAAIRSQALKNELTVEAADESDSQWVQRTLSKYKIQTPVEEEASDIHYQDPEEDNSGMPPDTIVRNQMPERTASTKTSSRVSNSDNDEEIELDMPEGSAQQNEQPIPQLDAKQLEAIIRAQSKEVIEKVVWQVVPEIATQIIEREIKKLLKERHDIGPR